MTYNSRLQPLQLFYTTGTIPPIADLQQTTCPTTIGTILHRAYNFGAGTNDNGNVQAIKNCRDNNRTQNFAYDSLNRISQGYTTGTNWGEDFTIDAWGNLTNRSLHPGKTQYEPLNLAPASTLNQLPGLGYDAAGNVTSNGSATYTYDAEYRLTGTAGVTYVYDGDGQRVKKTGTPTTLYWYGAGGNVLSETNGSGGLVSEYVFFNGQRIARRDADNSVHYYFADHLGSASVVTSNTGAIQKESDYYPYGGEIPIITGDPNHYKFTGKERDSESGLDNFGARYFTSNIGRFMTPDWAARPTMVPYAIFGDPQSLNLYTYVRNDPVSRADADGHRAVCIGVILICGDNTPASDQDKKGDTAQNQSQTKQLTADDVSKAVKTYDSDKGDKGRARIVKTLDTMGKDFTATGDVVRAGVKEIGVELPKAADKVLANVDSITRTGDKVVITNKDSMTIKLLGQLV